MPRGRKQLSDKQERILVQCQLMGLTTADLVTISNRLKALDKERDFRAKVAEVTEGMSWTESKKREFTVTDRQGRVYEVKVYADYSPDWIRRGHEFAKITISKSNKRTKQRVIESHRLSGSWDCDEIGHCCPNGNKYLYRIMRDIKLGRLEK